jgi:hypothetical protein
MHYLLYGSMYGNTNTATIKEKNSKYYVGSEFIRREE